MYCGGGDWSEGYEFKSLHQQADTENPAAKPQVQVQVQLNL